MAKLSKYSKLRPKVSPLTYIIIGLVFVALTLTIILSIDTPQQKFDKKYNLDSNNVFELSSFKKIEKRIASSEKVMVLFELEQAPNAEGQVEPTIFSNLIVELNDLVNKTKYYEYVKEDELAKFSKVYVVSVKLKERESFSEFLEEYKLKVTKSNTLLVYFNETAMQKEFDNSNTYSGELTAPKEEEAILYRNIKEFIKGL